MDRGLILKDRFLTQVAADIRYKLLKQVFRPDQSLDKLLQLAQMAFYGREYEEEEKRQKKTRESETLVMAVGSALKQPEEKCPEGPR